MKRGFTLVEIIVAIMIFSIVVVVALAALVKIVDANKKAQTSQDAVITLSFTLEAMSREMRSGSSYLCQRGTTGSFTTLSGQNISADCQGGLSSADAQGALFAFVSSRVASGGACRLIYAYRFRPVGAGSNLWFLDKATQKDCVTSVISDPGGADDSFSPLISTSTVQMSNYYMRMTNSAFPLAFIQMSGYAGSVEKDRTYFSVQTASSPRVPL